MSQRASPPRAVRRRRSGSGEEDRPRHDLDAGRPGRRRAECSGTYFAERNIVGTLPSGEQTIEYGGALSITKCKDSKRFANVKAGKFAELLGEISCRPGSCKGGLDLFAELRT